MNSLSGKVIEGLHTEKITACNSIAEFEDIKNKAESINVINVIGDKFFVNYTVNEEKVCEKSQRPIYLGVLIYDYAKRYMYEYGISKVGKKALIYQDTDCLKYRNTDFVAWKQWIDSDNVQVPHWEEVELVDPRYKNHKIYEENSKVFGSFEDELNKMNKNINKEGENNYVFYCLQKKTWLYAVNGEVKYRFKGLNSRCILLQDDSFGLSKYQKNKEIKDEKQIKKEKEKVKNMNNFTLYNFFNNNTNLCIGDTETKNMTNQVKLFEEVYQNKEAYVLCQSFRKIVKNTLRNVNEEDTHKHNKSLNTIQVQYTVKHIKI
jgi:hypothetical protein